MSQKSDLLLSTCQVSQQWTACFWDYMSGNVAQIYKNGGVAAPKTLNIIGNDYILTAESAKPLLHVWPMNSQEQMKNQKLILPKPTNVISVCPNNSYIAAGIESKLYIWQISSGSLLSIQQKHLQPVTCIKFVYNDFLITAGQDGMFIVYNFGNLICQQSNILPQNELGQCEPLYSKLDHSFPITDLHVGSFSSKSRIVTISLDQTCKIYNLIDGTLLLNLIFTHPLTAVIVDVSFWNLYVGDSTGGIVHFNLQNPPRTVDYHITKSDLKISKYVGHSKKINCLCLNLSGDILASGSDDFQLYLWEVRSKQIVRKLEHKGPITNLNFVLKHENIFNNTNFKPNFVIKPLERSFNLDVHNFIVPIIQNEKIEFENESKDCESSSVKQRILELESELSKAYVVNKQLYDGMITFLKKYNNVN